MSNEENQLPPPDTTPVETNESLIQKSFFEKYKIAIIVLVSVLVVVALGIAIYFVFFRTKSASVFPANNNVGQSSNGQNVSTNGGIATDSSDGEIVDSDGVSGDVVADGDVVVSDNGSEVAGGAVDGANGGGIVLDGDGGIVVDDGVADGGMAVEPDNNIPVTGGATLVKDLSYTDKKIDYRTSVSNFVLGRLVLTGAQDKDEKYTVAKAVFQFTGSFNYNQIVNPVMVVKNSDGVVEKTKSFTLAAGNPSNNELAMIIDLPKNSKKIIEFKGTLKADISNGDSVADSVQMIVGLGDASKLVFKTYGQTITAVKSTNMISAVLGVNTPKKSLVASNAMVEAAEFKMTAQKAKFIVRDLTFKFSGKDLAVSSIKNLVVKFDGKEVAKKALSTETNTLGVIKLDNLNLTLTPDTAALLTVYYETAAVDSKNANIDLSLSLIGMTALDSDSIDHAFALVAKSSSLILVKNYPVVSTNVLTNKLFKGVNSLYSMKISPKVAGEIAWKKAVFTMNATIGIFSAGMNVSTPDYTKDAVYVMFVHGPGVVAGEEGEILVMNNFKMYRQNAGGILTEVSGAFNFIHYEYGKVKVVFIPSQEQKISAAANYVLRGTVVNDLMAGNNVKTKIALESTIYQSDIFPVVGSMTGNDNFVWSDLSAGGAHSELSKDWHNEYLLEKFPTNEQEISYIKG